MTAIVQCPACDRACGVKKPARGEWVRCPHCDWAFAVEAVQGAGESSASASVMAQPQPADDAHTPQILPPSVLFGLALLPFFIPLVWTAARLLGDHEPALSLALPIALAVSAATLSIAVVSTIDWTPATRVKGVFMIVGLAYFTGTLLFFLKADAVEWIKRNIGETADWKETHITRGQCWVRAPGRLSYAGVENTLPGWKLECYRTRDKQAEDWRFTVGFARWPGWQRPAEGLPRAVMRRAAGDDALDERPISYQGASGQFPGQEWTIDLADGLRRVIRVYDIRNTLYYLAVDGPGISSDTAEVQVFFESFVLDEDR